MTTVSTALPSARPQRYFIVPSSAETCFLSTLGGVRKKRSASLARRGLERFVISSKLSAPRPSQVKICFAR